MAILNYTTGIKVERTAAEIQSKLAKAGACAIMFEYKEGLASGIAFKIDSPHGKMSFLLPSNSDGVLRAMMRDKKIERRLKTHEQAAKVSWRILKDWIEAQLAIIEAEMATLPQVFLPYLQTKEGPLYETLEQGGLPALMLTSAAQ